MIGSSLAVIAGLALGMPAPQVYFGLHRHGGLA